jgi:NAD-dependent oxidoreductase involved in siderophore biosynthesis
MQSWLDGALARYNNDNEALLPRTCALLGRIVDDPDLHARLINTLSLLEHTGSRKIVASQHGPGIDQPTLRHIAEEAHHAYFMKRQAEKAAGGATLEYVDRHLLAPATARMYFPRLEAAMMATLARERSARAAYLYMSMIVEFRALWFYRLYEQHLRRAGHPMSLKRILGEEHNHLHDVAGRLEIAAELSDTRATLFAGHEIRLYTRLLDAMEQATRIAGKGCA